MRAHHFGCELGARAPGYLPKIPNRDWKCTSRLNNLEHAIKLGSPIAFSKKNHEKNLLESEKTSNSASLSKVTSVAGLRMFVAFLVFATAPGM